MKINDKGQCPACLIKPMVYKRPNHRLWCHRCARQFDPATGEQEDNWAWSKREGSWVENHPEVVRS